MNEAERYGVRIVRADPGASGKVWSAVHVRKLPPEENRGRHHIYINALDHNGARAAAALAEYTWEGLQERHATPLDKPEPEPMGNVPIYSPGQVTSVWMGGMYPSDRVEGMHTRHESDGEGNHMGHHSFEVTFQLRERLPRPTDPEREDADTVQAIGNGVDTNAQPAFPPSILGMHEPGAEHALLISGQPGWVLHLAEIGLDGGPGSPTRDADYTPWSARGLGTIVRINHGYGDKGTIPAPQHYAEFAEACGRFVNRSRGCHHWIIGNEPNHEQERPQGKPITPGDYATCYHVCRRAILAQPGHEHDLVYVAGPAAWNTSTVYKGNAKGDWAMYLFDTLLLLHECDGISIHTYTHTHDPEHISSDVYHAAPGYTHLRNEFRTYRDFIAAIPARFAHKPLIITEFNPSRGWQDANNGYIQAALREIDQWNRIEGSHKVRGLIAYRWSEMPDQPQWSIANRHGVISDLRAAMLSGVGKQPPHADTGSNAVHVPAVQTGGTGKVGALLHPVQNPALRRVTQTFGARPNYYKLFTIDGIPLKGHEGIDFGLPEGSNIRAVSDGRAAQVHDTGDSGYGKYVLLQHPWGQTIYAHLNAFAVTVGDTVRSGQIIGLSGNTGNSTGPHLHFGMRVNPYSRTDGWGGYIDPAPYLRDAQDPMPVMPPPTPPVAAYTRQEIVDILRTAAREVDLRENLLVAQAYAENSFHTSRPSHMGAMGLLQIMPATWDEWAPRVGVTNPLDPRANARVGAHYLKWCTRQAGSTRRGLWAYVWGIGRVMNLGKPGQGALPPEEVRDYANRIMFGADLLDALHG